MKGNQGEKGEKGDKGPQGPPGMKGDPVSYYCSIIVILSVCF